jgi:hypothetical protein
MASRIVRPETTSLSISAGDWLLVKKRLNAGEQRAMFARMYLAGVDGLLRANPLQRGLAQITAYLLDWSLTAPDGSQIVIRDQPIEVVAAALDALDPESFGEIRLAVEAHEEAMAKAREQEKNGPDGEKASRATSLSPSGPA